MLDEPAECRELATIFLLYFFPKVVIGVTTAKPPIISTGRHEAAQVW
jgi:hypothetical protein